jgi:RNA recognition motif-containing protein
MAAIFVRGFDFGTTEDAVKKFCAKCGPVKEVEMFGRGAALVTYASADKANAAVEKLNGTTMPGNTRYVDVKLEDGRKRSRDGGSDGSTVFVRGFDFGTTDEQFESHCSSVGTIVKTRWFTKGSAAVTYSTPEEAKAAIDSLNKTTIDGNTRYIDVAYDNGPPAKKFKGDGKGMAWVQVPMWQAQGMMPAFGKGKGKGKDKGREDPPGSGRIFVRGFDFGTSEEQLLSHMSAVGEVADIHFATQGSAVVVFKRKVSATKAVNQLQNTVIDGNTRYIDIILKESE